MRECPNCKKLLEDGTKFCDACGTAIPESEPIQEVTADLYAEPEVIPQEPEAQAPAKESPLNGLLATLKKVPTKIWIIAGAAAAGLALIILLCCLIFGGGQDNYLMYIKEDELFFSDMGKDGAFQVTDRLLDDVESMSWSGGSTTISMYISINGDYIFYPDRIEDGSEGPTIYRRSLKDTKEEPIKIDADIICYAVNEKGNQMIYLKASGDLYLHDMENKEKLATEVTGVQVAKDLKKAIYKNEDGDLYLWQDGEEEKIVSEISSIAYMAADLSTVYYTKEDSLYKWTAKSGDKDKLDSDVTSVITVYDSGEVYYFKDNTAGGTVMDYVDDDMAAVDAAMTEPVAPEHPSYPDYPSRPSTPYSWNYDTTEEYEAAYAQYELDLAAYQEQYAQMQQAYEDAKDQYEIDYDAYQEACEEWWAKENRDSMREYLKEYTLNSSGYVLYYYNGEAVKLAEGVEGWSSLEMAADTAVLAFGQYVQGDVPRLKLSEIESAYSAYEQVREALGEEIGYRVAVGKDISELDEEDVAQLQLSSDGKTLYFLRDLDEDDREGELCKASISGGKVGKTETVDEGVSNEDFSVGSGGVAYFKNYKSDSYEGDLYLNGKEIDYDVYEGSVLFTGSELLYYTDYDSDKGMGTLKWYKKDKSVKISDDVADFTFGEDDDILYLYDVGGKSKTGTLYNYTGGEAEKLDEDVAAFIYHFSGIMKGYSSIYY